MAGVLCLSVPEYIRRCTNAHTTILEYDSFKLVPKDDNKNNAALAQQVEQLTCNQQVAGSIPVGGSNNDNRPLHFLCRGLFLLCKILEK